MNRRPVLLIAVSALVLLALGWFIGSALVTAQERQRAAQISTAVGSGFNYQARLNDGGVPANGSYDFTFKLFDDPVTLNQIGATLSPTLVISDGLFTAALDFGADAFNGDARYLEIDVQLSGGGGYTTLTPRQAISAVPYAVYASKVQPLENVVTVAKSGGDYTTVQDALDNINATAEDPVLIRVAPGVYTGTVDLESYVDIEGSGEGVTILRSVGGPFSHSSATLRTTSAVNAEVRFLTVESVNPLTTDYAIAIWAINAGADLRLTHVTANAMGGVQSYGIFNSSSSPTMNDVTSKASDAAGTTVAVYNTGASSPLMNNVTAGAPDGSTTWAIYNNGTSSPTVRNSIVTGSSNSIRNLDTASVLVASSKLDGDVNTAAVCLDSYDGSDQALDTACQAIISGDAVTWDDIANVPAMINPANVVLVATAGGDYSSVQDALDNISATAINPYLIRVAPGVYNGTVDLESFVDIEGSGQGVTILRGSGSGTSPNIDGSSATVRANGSISSEVRNLTVESVGSSTYATAIWTNGAGSQMRLSHISASASGGTSVNSGVFNRSSAPIMSDVTASASGGSFSYGVSNYISSAPIMSDVTASASGGTSVNTGISNDSSAPIMSDVTASASGGSFSYGVYNNFSSPEIRNSALTGATNSILNDGGSAMVSGSILDGSAAGPGFLCLDSSSSSDGLPLDDECRPGLTETAFQQRAQAPLNTSLTTVDNTSAEVGLYSSITVGSDGLPIVSYYDLTSGVLKVAHCSDLACSAATLTTVDNSVDVGYFSSITVGADGLPIISYYDGNFGNLKVAHCSDLACSAATLTTVDNSFQVGWYTSITIGDDGLPIVSYWDQGNGDLKVAHCSDLACSAATLTTVDDSANVGQYTSITIGADGLSIISYYDVDNGALKVAHCSDNTCSTANLTTVDNSADVGKYTSITIGASGWPIISYYDVDNGALKVAHCSDNTCSAATWTTVDNFSGDVGEYTSITIGADGLPIISYYDNFYGALKVAHCSDLACSSQAFGSYLDYTFLGATVGRYSAITIGADGLPIISYYDDTNGALKVAHCSNAFCRPYFRRR